MSRSFFRTMNLFFILPIAVSSYTEEDHNSKIAVSLTTEGSWNPVDGKANWENYVNVNAQTRLWKGAMAQVGILASQNTRIGRGKSWTVLDDPQSFSNIQTDKQVPFSPALVGITQHITDRFSVFVGVRNMNGDYFTTPFTGFAAEAETVPIIIKINVLSKLINSLFRCKLKNLHLWCEFLFIDLI